MPEEESQSTPKPRGGCLRSLTTLLTLAFVLALGACVFFVFQSQDLSDIKGRGPMPAGQKSVDLVAILNKAQNDNFAVIVSEEQINRYLKDRIVATQGGFLGKFVKLENVLVRLRPDRSEVIIERSIFGHPFTVSMYVRVESVKDAAGRITKEVSRDGGDYFKDLPRFKRGGHFGKLEVPQGFLILVMPSFEKLAAAMKPEIDASVGDMPRIEMRAGSMKLDPREEGDAKPSVENSEFVPSHEKIRIRPAAMAVAARGAGAEVRRP